VLSFEFVSCSAPFLSLSLSRSFSFAPLYRSLALLLFRSLALSPPSSLSLPLSLSPHLCLPFPPFPTLSSFFSLYLSLSLFPAVVRASTLPRANLHTHMSTLFFPPALSAPSSELPRVVNEDDKISESKFQLVNMLASERALRWCGCGCGREWVCVWCDGRSGVLCMCTCLSYPVSQALTLYNCRQPSPLFGRRLEPYFNREVVFTIFFFMHILC